MDLAAARMSAETHGRAAYGRYGATTGGKTHDGRDLPAWEQLGDLIQRAWMNAAADDDGPIRCHHCGGWFVSEQERAEHKLDVLIYLVTKEGITMDGLDPKLDQIEAGETAIEGNLATMTADETRELADLAALKAVPANTLSPEQAARLDELSAKQAAVAEALANADAAINAADPAPVDNPAPPVDTTPPADGDQPPADGTDGTGDAGTDAPPAATAPDAPVSTSDVETAPAA